MKFKRILEKKKKQYAKRRDPRDVNIDLDDWRRFFDVSKLNFHEIRYLLDENFKVVFQQDLKGKREYYLIKPFENESKQHCFLVNLIYYTLKDNFDYVKTYNTREPDVVFRIKNKFIAFEIESGKGLRHKKRFLEKIKSLKENYGDDWFIVVTNRDNVGKYKQYGKAITRKNFLKKVGSYVDFDIK